MLVSLPKGDLSESYLTFVAGLNVDVRESLEDMLFLVNTLPDGMVAALAAKTRVVQAARATLEKVGRLHKISLVAAKDGADASSTRSRDGRRGDETAREDAQGEGSP